MLKNKKVRLIISIGVLVSFVALLFAAGCAAPAPGPAPAKTVTVTATPAAPEKKVYDWKIQGWMVAGTPNMRTLDQVFVPRVRELTNDRIRLTVYYGAELVPTVDVVDGLAEGVLDMAYTGSGYHLGLLGPVGGFTDPNPFTFQSMAEWQTLFYDLGLLEIAREMYRPHNVHLIGEVLSTSSVCPFTKVPINRLSDFEGVKMRAYGTTATLLDKFGASTVFLPGEEIYTALATGVIDGGAFGSPSHNFPYGLHEVAKYWIQPSLNWYSNDVLIRTKLWEELPRDLQAALEVAVFEWGNACGRLLLYEDMEALTKMVEDFGVSVITLPEEDVAEMVRLASELWDELAGDDPAALKALEIIRDYQRYLGRL